MQSWGEMHKVVDEFIELAIDNDETYGETKKKKRLAWWSLRIRKRTAMGRQRVADVTSSTR
jgi:hypothetical protein